MSKRLRTGSGLPLLRPSFPEAEVITYIERGDEPDGPSAGSLYMDDGTNTSTGDAGMRYYDGSVWQDIADFARGTFTPTLLPSTSGTITLGGSTGGRYTLVGRMVTIWAYIDVGSVAAPTGNCDMGGLPFRVSADSPTFINIQVATSNVAMSGSYPLARVGPTGTTLRMLLGKTTGTGFANIPAASFTASSIVYVSGSYETDFL